MKTINLSLEATYEDAASVVENCTEDRFAVNYNNFDVCVFDRDDYPAEELINAVFAPVACFQKMLSDHIARCENAYECEDAVMHHYV